jgi:two-component system, OmpR family, KDP operon response regulator KdpE
MPRPVWNILIVDDEPTSRRKLWRFFTVAGHNAEETASVSNAMDRLLLSCFQFVLLDLDIPGMCATNTCGMIRSINPRIGLITLSTRNSEQDRIATLEAGADYYLTKPLGLQELIARLYAIHRRVRTGNDEELEVLNAGELQMDFHRHSVRRAGEVLRLNPKEFNLLALLMKHQGHTVTSTRLLRTIWGPSHGDESEYLKSYIKTLRKKIEADPAKPKYILTERRVGYRFCDPTAVSSA